MANYILQQGNNILSNGNYIFQTGDEIAPPVADYDPSLLALADGAAVGQIRDGSGQNAHASQPTAAKQATFRTNQLNGYPAIQFDGVDDEYLLPFAFAAKTVFLVQRTPTTSQANVNIINYSPNIRAWDGGSGNNFFDSGNGGNLGIEPSNSQNSVYVNNSKNRYSPSIVLRNATYNLLCIDVTDNRPIDQLSKRGAGAGWWAGFLVRLIIYDFRMNYAERQLKGAQLLTQYGL